MKVVCIGDSITAGQYLTEGRPWPNLITGYDVVPAGKNSDTTRLGLERFPAIQQMTPAAIVIQFGHNDCNRWESDRGLPRVSPRAYSANLEEMVDRARAFEAVPFLCTLTPTTRDPNYAGEVAIYNAILREVADVTKAEVIDVRSAFADRDGLLLEDGLHLSPHGHGLYAETVQAVLDTFYR